MSAHPATTDGDEDEIRPWFAAHELFTCLNAVRGGSELLLSGAAGPLGAEALGTVATIAEAARALERHIRHCQAIERLREKPRPALRPVSLAALLPAAAEPPSAVTVLAAVGEIRAALALLWPHPGGRPRVIERSGTVLLQLDRGSGEEEVAGGILWTLAGLHLRRGGGRLLPPPATGGVRLLLRKAHGPAAGAEGGGVSAGEKTMGEDRAFLA